MLCEALGRKLTAEERFAVRALTVDPSLLSADHKHSPTCEYEYSASQLRHSYQIYIFFIKRFLDLYSPLTVQTGATFRGLKHYIIPMIPKGFLNHAIVNGFILILVLHSSDLPSVLCLSEYTGGASRKLERQAANRHGGQGSHDTAGWIQRALGARNQ